MIRRRALLLAAVVASTVAGDAFAQDAPAPAAPSTPASTENQTDARALAETLFFTGRGLMEGGRFAQACEKFGESYRLDPAAGTLLNLAVCHEKAGKLASAWGEFRQALAEARHAQKADREQLAKDAIARIEPDLPFVTIVVPEGARVPGLQVARNGAPLLAAAWDTELPIDPGQNEIEVSAPEYKPAKKTITIEKKQHLTVTIDPLVLAPIERPPPPFWTGKRKLGFVIGSAGVLAAGAGAVFGVLALNNKSKSDDNCPTFDGELRCSTTGSSAMSTAKTDAWISDIGVGVGAAAIVVGGILLITGGAKDESGPQPLGAKPEEKASWDWRFNAGPHGAQGFLTRSF